MIFLLHKEKFLGAFVPQNYGSVVGAPGDIMPSVHGRHGQILSSHRVTYLPLPLCWALIDIVTYKLQYL
jgi:hypothetical protein